MHKSPPKDQSALSVSIWKSIKSRFKKRQNAELFGGDDQLFKQLLSNSTTYAEYGCGASTIWVANNTQCNVYSVDSAESWIKVVATNCKDLGRVNLHYADVGPIKRLGRPLNYDRFEHFSDYTDWIWEQAHQPDTVLIDGRFRVCCFLTSLLRGKEGTRIVFDDYTHRDHYHIVERFLKPTEIRKRQALFIVPKKESIDLEQLKIFVDRFRFVFE